jgi:DNA helicase-2/ATP-dependent DNA helicase PcrA
VRFDPFSLAEALGLHRPTADQATVIASPLAPAVVVAGAGSGKTETMATRVMWLVANELAPPESVLGLTFTKKAAAELAHRLRRRLNQLRGRDLLRPGDDGTAGDPTVSTYHAYASRLIAEHGLRVGIEPSTRLLGEAATWQLAHRVVHSYAGPMDAVDVAPATVVDAIISLAGEMAEHLVEPEELDRFIDAFCTRIERLPRKAGGGPGEPYAGVRAMVSRQRGRQQLLPLIHAYQRAKRDAEALDFGDQMRLAAQIATASPEVGRVERERFGVVLLDEYQDTGHSQLVMLRALFAGGHPVTGVGDPCQSIYSWRGASAGTLSRFREEFRDRSGQLATRYALRTSFRNGGRVLRVANAVSKELRANGLEVDELLPGPGIGEGHVVCALHETVADETTDLVRRVRLLWTDNERRRAEALELRSIAVLCRKRNRLEPLAEALRDAGVPVEVVGLGGLLATPEVRDVVATLRVLTDPTAGDALMRLLTGPRWRIGPRDLEALGRWARVIARPVEETAPDGVEAPDGLALDAVDPVAPEPDEIDGRSIVDALDRLPSAEWFSAEGYRRLRQLGAELAALRKRSGQPLPDLVADVERTLRIDVEIAARPGRSPALARGNLDRFLDVCADFVHSSPQAGLGAFVDYLAAAEERERGLAPGEVDVDPERVQLLTVHGAKGLEWDAVFVPGMVDGFFPSSPGSAVSSWTRDLGALPFPLRGDADQLPVLAIEDSEVQKDLEDARLAFRERCGERELLEERRLAYVALTRSRLLLVCSGHRWGSKAKPYEPSAVLTEVRDACLAGAGEVAVWVDVPGDGALNPVLAESVSAVWPYDPLGARRADVEAGAHLVISARQSLVDGESARQSAPTDSLTDDPLRAGWRRDVDLLLAERRRRARRDEVVVDLPAELSVSRLVALRRDPADLARRIRRPVPQRPEPLARRGTAFHLWLEQRFHADVLLDVDALPGAADAGAADDAELHALQAAFEGSAWADRTPYAVEVPFQTVLGGVVVRGRMDAVFRDAGGTFEVVDWKTGRRPTGADADASAVQLAAYRVAWADLAGAPVTSVGAAFHYVRSNETVRPVDLLDADGLAALVLRVPASVSEAAADLPVADLSVADVVVEVTA